MKFRKNVLGVAVAAVLAFGAYAAPAHATVHEIVAQWCSGQEELGPPGISKDGSKNFAQPLNAAGVVVTIVDPIAKTVLITFDYSHPAVKVQSSGIVIPIGMTPEGFTVLLDLIEPDPSFPAFQHCPALGL
jgi:hypothetical protein